MYMFAHFFISVFIIFGAVNCIKIPSFHIKSPDFSGPANINFAKIIEQYDLDPLHENCTKGQVSDLKYTICNINMLHLKNCKITKLVFNYLTHKFNEEWECPSLFVNFQNEATGNFVDVELKDQKGYIEITTGKVKMIVTGSYKEIVRNNQTYNEIKNVKIKAKTMEHINMDNYTVTQGDQAKSDLSRDNFNGKDQKTGVEFTEGLMQLLLETQFVPALKDYLLKTPKTMALSNENSNSSDDQNSGSQEKS